MKKSKIERFIRPILGIILIAVICSSCKNNDEIIPNYVGKWMTVKAIASTSGFVSVNYSLTLTDHTFTETFLTDVYQYTYLSPGKFVTIEGSVSVADISMTFNPEKISFSYYDYQTSKVSDPYETITSSDQNLDGILSGFVFPTSGHNAKYSVSGNELTLKEDYSGENATTKTIYTWVYTRQ